MSAGLPHVCPLLAQRGSETCQSSLRAIAVAPEKRVTVGLASTPGTPKVAREGPMARTRTVFGVVPPMMKPPMRTLSPVWTRLRVERLTRVGGRATGLGTNSYAPMSHAAPWGRAMPRWSVDGGGQPLVTASIAGLPGRRAWVCVGPPLATSGPRRGLLTFGLSLG